MTERPGMFETWAEAGGFLLALLVAYALVVGVFFGLVWALMGVGWWLTGPTASRRTMRQARCS